MAQDQDQESRWLRVLDASVHLQRLVPDAVLVGGTAAALHAAHRMSFDDDHALHDLTQRFDVLLEALESSEGWITSRVRRPVLILGSLDGVETGIRQLFRRRPLEVEEWPAPSGTIRVPTLAEMTRVKAWLVLRRNSTRDYLDLVALADRLGEDAPATILGLDSYYADQVGPGGVRVATQVAKQLAEPVPYDLSEVDLAHYRGLSPRWQEWPEVVAACRWLATAVLARSVEGPEL